MAEKLTPRESNFSEWHVDVEAVGYSVVVLARLM
jgi:hypothetical protein